MDTEFATERDLRTVQEVWFNWSQVEKDLELWLAEQDDIDPVRGVSTRKADKTDFALAYGFSSSGGVWNTSTSGREPSGRYGGSHPKNDSCSCWSKPPGDRISCIRLPRGA